MRAAPEIPVFLDIERFVGGQYFKDNVPSVYFPGQKIRGKINESDILIEVGHKSLFLNQADHNREYPALILDGKNAYFPKRLIAPTTVSNVREMLINRYWLDDRKRFNNMVKDIYLKGLDLAGEPNERISLVEKSLGFALGLIAFR